MASPRCKDYYSVFISSTTIKKKKLSVSVRELVRLWDNWKVLLTKRDWWNVIIRSCLRMLLLISFSAGTFTAVVAEMFCNSVPKIYWHVSFVVMAFLLILALTLCTSLFAWDGQKQPLIGSQVAFQLYWNHTSARVFSCKFAAYFSEHLFLRTPLRGCFWMVDEYKCLIALGNCHRVPI